MNMSLTPLFALLLVLAPLSTWPPSDAPCKAFTWWGKEIKKKKYGRNWVTSYVQVSVQTNLLRKLHKAPKNTGIYKFFGIKMSSDAISEHLNFSGRLSGHALRPLCKQSCDPLSQVTFTTYAHSNTIKWTTGQYSTVPQMGREWG